jgi:hypothetical protein
LIKIQNASYSHYTDDEVIHILCPEANQWRTAKIRI